MGGSLQVGQAAPDFELRDHHGQPVHLAAVLERATVVLVFYPLAFTPTCTGELCALRDDRAVVEREGVQVLAVSCDAPASLRVFAEREGIGYPLLSDFWPHGEVSRRYGVFLEERGFATRATFVLDRSGTVRWSVVNSPADARSTADLEAALDALPDAVHSS